MRNAGGHNLLPFGWHGAEVESSVHHKILHRTHRRFSETIPCESTPITSPGSLPIEDARDPEALGRRNGL